MGTLFDYSSMVEDNNLVGITDGGETVGNDKGGTPLHDGVHTPLDELFRSGVDRGRCLVENQNWWV